MEIGRWWNHRNRAHTISQPRQGLEIFSDYFRWFHHRIISYVPPAQRFA
jgi:hypothetical protein